MQNYCIFLDYPISNANSNDDLMPISYVIGSRIQLISAFGKTYKSKKMFCRFKY